MAPAPAYCPHCGTVLVERTIEGRERRYCTDCEWTVYRNPHPAAGILVVRSNPPSLLLVRRSGPPATGKWSLPAGYLEWDEPPASGAVRELEEETGLSVASEDLSLLATRFRPSANGGYTLVVIYVTPEAATEGRPRAGSDADAVRFFEREHLSADVLEPTYKAVFEDAIDVVAGQDDR